jgi:hypothetical protein
MKATIYYINHDEELVPTGEFKDVSVDVGERLLGVFGLLFLGEGEWCSNGEFSQLEDCLDEAGLIDREFNEAELIDQEFNKEGYNFESSKNMTAKQLLEEGGCADMYWGIRCIEAEKIGNFSQEEVDGLNRDGYKDPVLRFFNLAFVRAVVDNDPVAAAFNLVGSETRIRELHVELNS